MLFFDKFKVYYLYSCSRATCIAYFTSNNIKADWYLKEILSIDKFFLTNFKTILNIFQ